MPEPAKHPGQRVLVVLRARGISVSAAAEALDCYRPTLSRFLHGHASLSVKMAKAIEDTLEISAADLLRQQVSYDLETYNA